MNQPGQEPGSGALFREAHCAEQYDDDRFGGEFGRYLHDQEVTLFNRLLGRPQRVLDAGGGTGKLSLALLRQGHRVTTADFSGEMLRIARRKAESVGLEGSFALSDIQALCFRDRAFGGTVSSRVLMHVPDWRKGIAEVCRVTAEVLVLDLPPSLSVAGVDALRKRLRPGRQGAFRQAYRTFSMRAIAGELRRHDFRIVELDRGWLLPVAWHRRLNAPAWSRRIEQCFRYLGLVHVFGAPVTIKAMRVSA
jgi:ubiquinone/menaquinone biosynthesis C-methylase UbiE